jgi:hypothetical protein
MIRAEWTLNTLRGPVVGHTEREDVDAAFTALVDAVSAALPSWGPEHAAAFARLRRAASAALARGDRFEHRSAGVAILLTRVDPPR